MYGERGLADLRAAAATLIAATCAGQTASADFASRESRPSCASISAEAPVAEPVVPAVETGECSAADPADVSPN